MEDIILVRVYGKKTELFVDRENELRNFRILHSHNCGPELYCTFQNGICYEFVKGTVLDKWLVREPTIYRLVAMEMARIHSIKPENGHPVKPVLWKKLSTYLSLINASMTDSRVSEGEATRPIVPEDNTDLNGSTADTQVPCQPQGSLVRSEPWIPLLT
ncbi:UNVERIFIED_CONTAM: hypothetical protein FKN15_053941 [Acipenser sinensis]